MPTHQDRCLSLITSCFLLCVTDCTILCMELELSLPKTGQCSENVQVGAHCIFALIIVWVSDVIWC